MSHRILQLEAERRSARLVRDKADREVRALRSRTTKDIHKLASGFLQELREQSRELRGRTFDSMENYLQWLTAEASTYTARLQSIDGETGRLALAELRLVVANDTVCAINRELTRLQGDRYVWTSGTRPRGGFAPVG